MRSQYLEKLRKEVDFHHKVAYKFERVYKLQKTKKPIADINVEIVQEISQHPDYLVKDPDALFYCLFFCIFYNNPYMVEFLRLLITKMNFGENHNIRDLLSLIDENGLDRLRCIGEPLNAQIYHEIMFEAFHDGLKVVYSSVIN